MVVPGLTWSARYRAGALLVLVLAGCVLAGCAGTRPRHPVTTPPPGAPVVPLNGGSGPASGPTGVVPSVRPESGWDGGDPVPPTGRAEPAASLPRAGRHGGDPPARPPRAPAPPGAPAPPDAAPTGGAAGLTDPGTPAAEAPGEVPESGTADPTPDDGVTPATGPTTSPSPGPSESLAETLSPSPSDDLFGY